MCMNEDIDIGRKLDKRNELLMEINMHTSAFPEIKGDTSAIKVRNNLNAKFDSFIHGQEEHNLRLEKILKKLAER